MKRTNPLGAYGVVEHLEYHESIGCLAVVLGKAVILCYISSSGEESSQFFRNAYTLYDFIMLRVLGPDEAPTVSETHSRR